MAGIATDQVRLRRVSDDLEVSIIGTADKLTPRYSGSAYRVEEFKTSDDKTLLDSQVQSLVSAMAVFAPPAMGQTTLPEDYRTSLAPALASSWGSQASGGPGGQPAAIDPAGGPTIACAPG